MTRYKAPILTSLYCRCKLALFLLGGFTQKLITQALLKAKNRAILNT